MRKVLKVAVVGFTLGVALTGVARADGWGGGRHEHDEGEGAWAALLGGFLGGMVSPGPAYVQPAPVIVAPPPVYYPPPGYAYPPPGYAYPPPGYAYPPPAYVVPQPGYAVPYPYYDRRPYYRQRDDD